MQFFYHNLVPFNPVMSARPQSLWELCLNGGDRDLECSCSFQTLPLAEVCLLWRWFSPNGVLKLSSVLPLDLPQFSFSARHLMNWMVSSEGLPSVLLLHYSFTISGWLTGMYIWNINPFIFAGYLPRQFSGLPPGMPWQCALWHSACKTSFKCADAELMALQGSLLIYLCCVFQNICAIWKDHSSQWAVLTQSSL